MPKVRNFGSWRARTRKRKSATGPNGRPLMMANSTGRARDVGGIFQSTIRRVERKKISPVEEPEKMGERLRRKRYLSTQDVDLRSLQEDFPALWNQIGQVAQNPDLYGRVAAMLQRMVVDPGPKVTASHQRAALEILQKKFGDRTTQIPPNEYGNRD